jgi:hypothetical protein
VAQPSPDRRGAEERLGAADRHLAEADERLRHVEEAVLPGLTRDRRGAAVAEAVLATMRHSREVMLRHRRLLGELAGVDPEP